MIIYDKSRMDDISEVGGKGLGLAKLVAYGLTVPDFFVVTAGTDLYDTEFAAMLDAFAATLHCESFAVRSSSVSEDAAEGSFAGQYSTKLNVKSCELLDAVRQVALSCENVSVKKYSEHFQKRSRAVAVIVQKQLHGEFSGVMFTTSPYCRDERIIECVRGTGEQLVSGFVNPLEQKTFKKSQPPTDAVYGKLAAYAELLESKEGRPLDIEWTYDGEEVCLLQMRPLTAVGDSIPEISNRKWNLYVYRDFCNFAHSVQCIASAPSVQEKVFGFSVPIAEGLIVNGREFYSEESDRQANEVWEKLDCGNFFSDYITKIKNSVRATVKRADALKSSNTDNLSDAQLFDRYVDEIRAYIQSYVPLMMRPDDYLFEKLVLSVGKNRAESFLQAASIVDRQTYYSSERSSFLLSLINGDMQGYIDKYEWITSPLGKKAEAVTAERYLKRAEGWDTAKAVEKLEETAATRRKDYAAKKKFAQSLTDEERRLFDIISEFIYLRTYTAENSDRYFYYIRKRILALLAERMNISEEALLLMTPSEVLRTQNGFKLSPQEISKRKSGEVIVIQAGKCRAYYSGESYSLLKKLLPQSNTGVTVLEGKVACMGEVCAKVKIVNNLAQAEEFQEGSILVTTMTVPEITSALDKACGIITDEGGITCHAAIIAREYAVPCLVGTGNATTVLKDGMVVKLDCINGKVKIEA